VRIGALAVRNHYQMLPTPEAHGLSGDTTIVVPVPADGLTLFRLLETSEPQLSDFEPGWTRPQGQLRGIPEISRTSISACLEPARALGASNRPVTYVARLELEPGPLTRVARTRPVERGHVDVWAYPSELLRAVADVVRVRGVD